MSIRTARTGWLGVAAGSSGPGPSRTWKGCVREAAGRPSSHATRPGPGHRLARGGTDRRQGAPVSARVVVHVVRHSEVDSCERVYRGIGVLTVREMPACIAEALHRNGSSQESALAIALNPEPHAQSSRQVGSAGDNGCRDADRRQTGGLPLGRTLAPLERGRVGVARDVCACSGRSSRAATFPARRRGDQWTDVSGVQPNTEKTGGEDRRRCRGAWLAPLLPCADSAVSCCVAVRSGAVKTNCEWSISAKTWCSTDDIRGRASAASNCAQNDQAARVSRSSPSNALIRPSSRTRLPISGII